jgi:hypothetical protein
MLKSESIKTLLPALFKAQQQIGVALKSSFNPHLKSKYADLSSVIEACKLPLAEQGIIILQTIGEDTPPCVTVTTALVHVMSGEWIEASLRLRAAKDDPQGIGGAVTYARRFTLQTIAGVCAEDDDGHAASHAPPPPRPPSYRGPDVMVTGATAGTVTAATAGTSNEVIHVGRETSFPISTPVLVGPIPAEPPSINTRIVKPSAAGLKERKEAAMAKLIKSIGTEKADATLADLKAKNNNAKTTKDAQAIVDVLEKLTKDLK